jgi:hypothetical protein
MTPFVVQFSYPELTPITDWSIFPEHVCNLAEFHTFVIHNAESLVPDFKSAIATISSINLIGSKPLHYDGVDLRVFLTTNKDDMDMNYLTKAT